MPCNIIKPNFKLLELIGPEIWMGQTRRMDGRTDGLNDELGVNCYMGHMHMSSSIFMQNLKCL